MSLENDATLPEDQLEVVDFDAVQPDAIDTLAEVEEGYALAAEALMDRVRSLESIAISLQEVPESALTPELAQVVMASIMLPDEPAIATENNDDITDVEAKGQRWDNLKSRATKAAKTMAEAVKRLITTIIDFISDVFNWITTSRRSITKELEKQKSEISNGKPSVNVQYNRRMQALTKSGTFNAEVAKASLNRYAELLAASTYAVQNVLHFTTSFKDMKFRPEAWVNFNEHMVERTKGALDWKAKGAGSQIFDASALDGEAGLNVMMRFDYLSGLSVRTEPAESDVQTTEAPFTKGDVATLNKQGLTLMKGVAACEPEIKKVQNSLRRLMSLDLALVFASGGSAHYQIHGTSPTAMFMQMRQFLNFANKIGVGMSVKGAGAVARVGRAYLAGEIAADDESKQSEFNGVIEPKLLTA